MGGGGGGGGRGRLDPSTFFSMDEHTTAYDHNNKYTSGNIKRTGLFPAKNTPLLEPPALRTRDRTLSVPVLITKTICDNLQLFSYPPSKAKGV